VFVKICGLRTARDVSAAVEAGADALGFVLTGSPRQVAPRIVADLVADVPPDVMTVAVFRGEPPDEVRRATLESGVSTVQLHGDHPPEDFAALRDLPIRLIRAISSASGGDLGCGAFGEHLLIVDSSMPGSGRRWAWEGLASVPPSGRWMLAGGLDPDNVAEAIAAVRPWGVDVSSGVEVRHGVKDLERIRRFVRAARSATSSAAAGPARRPRAP
jgi:phosphoribosylanthranilate isomerase